jgi:hypothetical protein
MAKKEYKYLFNGILYPEFDSSLQRDLTFTKYSQMHSKLHVYDILCTYQG